MSNERFIYEGRHLREWLLQLVEENPERRLEASTAINDHLSRVDLFGQPEWSLEQITEEFQKAIRETVREPGFPQAEYVKKLLSLKMRLSELEYAALRQWGMLIRNEDKEAIKGPSAREPQFTGFALASVIDALGEELMPAMEQLRLMHKNKPNVIIAANAISRMGATAIEFYPDLLAGLSLDDSNGEYSKPLGYLLRHYPDKVNGIYEMTNSTNPTVRENAIATLMHCGRETVQKCPEIESMARERWKTSADQDWLAWARMLGETAVAKDTITLLLEETRSKENWHVSTAIDCLGAIGMDSERVVPRLIELLDEFKEYDSDWGWSGGEHSRIVTALGQHGAAGSAAIPRLTQLIWSKPHLETNSREPNQGVVEFLGKFGAEAQEALPALKEMEARLSGNQCPEYLSEAISKIGGT